MILSLVKFKFRIKSVDGQGFWPAFLMLPTGGSWPCDGEIDIMEQWGGDGPTNQTTGETIWEIVPIHHLTIFIIAFQHTLNRWFFC